MHNDDNPIRSQDRLLPLYLHREAKLPSTGTRRKDRERVSFENRRADRFTSS